MLVVHHLGISQSERIVWLCEELDIAYQLTRYERDPVTGGAPENYRALYPFGTAPVITDDDLVLGESGAIIEYVIQKHGGGRLAVKPDQPNYANYLYWFHFANGSLMPMMMGNLIVAMLGCSDEQKQRVGLLSSRNGRAFLAMEEQLGKTQYFAGNELTAADIIMLFPLTTMRAFAPHHPSRYPNIRAYLQRVGTRPAYQRAMQKADPGFTPVLE